MSVWPRQAAVSQLAAAGAKTASIPSGQSCTEGRGAWRMSRPDEMEATPADAVLCDADIAVTREGAATLPGVWYLDPLIDTRRARPRAWIRADELADHRVDAICLERSFGLVLITICRDDEDDREALPSLVLRQWRGQWPASGCKPRRMASCFHHPPFWRGTGISRAR